MGYILRNRLITLYRGLWYHLKEYSALAPQNPEELFNHRHASLRNVIERSFGVLKKRFPIISGATEPHFSVGTTTEIVLACCILHNFLMGVDPDEELIAEVDEELLSQNTELGEFYSRQTNDEEAKKGAALRNEIAQRMWQNYVLE